MLLLKRTSAAPNSRHVHAVDTQASCTLGRDPKQLNGRFQGRPLRKVAVVNHHPLVLFFVSRKRTLARTAAQTAVSERWVD